MAAAVFRSCLVATAAVLTLAAGARGQQPAAPETPAATGDVLYRMTLLRAAPGKQQDLLDEIESTIVGIVKARPDRRPLILRHAQGDHWDVMFLAPIGTYAEHFGKRSAVNSAASPELVAWQEDEFVRGPDLSTIPGFFDARVYHVEMFNALADKREELVRERIMENMFVTAVGRPLNAIFVRELGASWDVFTIGAYRNWRHYAERDDTDPQKALAAARAAGFVSDTAVAPYLRSLINTHHDTLATPIR